MRLPRRLPGFMPLLPRERFALEGPGLILCPDCHAKICPQRVGVLDQLFFASVSGSMTVTTPLLRFRCAWPVSHQLRVRPHWSPASCNTVQMVEVLTRPKNRGA